MAKKDTWEKIIRLGKKALKKKQILNYYAKLWKNDRLFRKLVTSEGVFVRAVYKNKPIIKRRKIRVKSFEDLKELIKNHAVEFHIPQKTLRKVAGLHAIDVDIDERKLKLRPKLMEEFVRKLRQHGIKPKIIVKTPSGFHIFINYTDRKKAKKALAELADNKNIKIAKSVKHGVAIDFSEPNIAIPNILSVKGGKKYEARKY